MKKLTLVSILIFGSFQVMAWPDFIDELFDTQSSDNIECVTLDNNSKDSHEVCESAELQWKIDHRNSEDNNQIIEIKELEQYNDPGRTVFSHEVEITTKNGKTQRVHIPAPPGIPF